MAYSIEDACSLFEKFPRAGLGFFPTPLYRLENLSEKLGIELYIKRDDFTGTSLFGGNKVRKLEYLLGQAKADGCEYVITYGATQSNHAMETVSCARKLGMQPILYLTAVVEPDEEDIRSNLLLDRILGAEIHIVDILPGETEDDAEQRSFAMGAQRARELNESGHLCVDIPMGGANVTGSIGFARGWLEMEKQLRTANLKMDYVFHSTGTGGTMAGMAAGRKLIGSTIRQISVSCSFKNEAYLVKVENIANQVLEKLGTDLRVCARTDLQVENGYYYPGYEQPNEKATEAILMLARTEGLLVDPVYTGKALAGLIDYVRTGRVEKGSSVLFWHTGGATALFAEKEILGKIY